MMIRSVLLALVACAAATAVRAQQMDCTGQGELRFICGVDAAEDTVAIPGTRWLIASGLGFGGAATIKGIDTQTGGVHALYPTAGTNRVDRSFYPDCPGAPSTVDFSTVGLAITPLGRRDYLLYAVNDGARHAVEVFTVSVDDESPALAWIGCVVLPPNTNGNAVAALPERAFAVVSMDDGGANRMARHVAGETTGSVYLWAPGAGLTRIDGIELRGGNGIVASRDGRTLYVSAWSGGEIVKIRRDGRAPPEVAKLGYLPDNLHWASDGSILVAAQRPPVARIASCTGAECIADWLVAKIDPRTLTSRTLVEAKGNTVVNYVTGATEQGDALYLANRGQGQLGVIAERALPRAEPLRLSPPR
jgi:hypothetical protein